MTDRAEILRELGLLPVWRLRARTPALGIQESLPHDFQNRSNPIGPLLSIGYDTNG